MLINPENWQPQGIKSLENAASLALKATGNVLVTAGAGAGKSEFLAQKAAYLLQTGLCPAPQKILAISFKKDAAENLKERIKERCEPALARRFDSMTFDAFAKKLYEQFYKAVPEDYKPQDQYDLVFYNRATFKQYLKSKGYNPGGWKKLEKCLATCKLPLDSSTVTHDFWQSALYSAENSQLSFAMFNRLVDYLLRTNSHLLKALQLTYPVVFLDEFQDTTEAQFQLVRTAFKGSKTALTAVGDDKQKIMGWAGALPDAFQNFSKEFNAQHYSLLFNWRSHPELVELQQRIANKIDNQAPQVKARASKTTTGGFTNFKEFETTDAKSTSIANFIKTELAKDHLKAEDFAILVRMQVGDIEQQLEEAFAIEGVQLRNLARFVGSIDIQELLKQELTNLVIPIFYLLIQKRAPEYWQQATKGLNALQGLFAEDEVQQRLVQEALQEFIKEQSPKLKNRAVNTGNVKLTINEVIRFIGEANIRQAITAYQKEEDYTRVLEGIYQLLGECCDNQTSWLKALDCFMGKNQVQLLTIHKSKGLEYHTVLLLGIDSESWWSLKNPNQNTEELNALFVAVTRAKQRIVFLLSKEKGRKIEWVERLVTSF